MRRTSAYTHSSSSLAIDLEIGRLNYLSRQRPRRLHLLQLLRSQSPRSGHARKNRSPRCPSSRRRSERSSTKSSKQREVTLYPLGNPQSRRSPSRRRLNHRNLRSKRATPRRRARARRRSERTRGTRPSSDSLPCPLLLVRLPRLLRRSLFAISLHGLAMA